MFYAKLKRQVELTGLMLLETDQDRRKELEKERQKIVNELFTTNTPNNYRSSDETNCIAEMDRTFGTLSALLEGNGTPINDKTTTFMFYSRIEYMNKKHKKKK